MAFQIPPTSCRQGALESGVDVAVHGPIPQAHFLGGLGIEARLDALLEKATVEEQTSLITGFNRLVGGQEHSLLANQAVPISEQEQEAKENSSHANAESEGQQAGGLAEGLEANDNTIEEEGMGFTYKVMALTSAGVAPPVPFSYKSLEN